MKIFSHKEVQKYVNLHQYMANYRHLYFINKYFKIICENACFLFRFLLKCSCVVIEKYDEREDCKL